MTETEAEQLLADLAGEFCDPEPYDAQCDVTVYDVMAQYGVGVDRARSQLNRLASEGVLSKRMVRIPGKPPTAAYRRVAR